MSRGFYEVYDEFSRRLSSLGKVVLAGGAVRDFLMEQGPKDYDVFVLHSTTDDMEVLEKQVLAAVSDLSTIPPVVEWHKSEPFLVATVEWESCEIQVLVNPAKSMEELVDSFDWNVCLFAYDGEGFHMREDVGNIAKGKDLALNRVTFPLSTLRRGFRFSERFIMKLKKEDIETLCRAVIQKVESKNLKGPDGAEPDMPSLEANALPW